MPPTFPDALARRFADLGCDLQRAAPFGAGQ
jgi:hypothetical protein